MPFEDFEQLYEYCYRVAGVVGLASIYVWGFEGGERNRAAGHRSRRRVPTHQHPPRPARRRRPGPHLPAADELAAIGVSEEDLRARRGGDKFRELMRFQIARAEQYYEISAPLEICIAARQPPDARSR